MQSCFPMILLAFIITLSEVAEGWNVTFDPSEIEGLYVDKKANVTVSIRGDGLLKSEQVAVSAFPESILSARVLEDSWTCVGDICNTTIEVQGLFLGFGRVSVLMKDSKTIPSNDSSWKPLQPPLQVTVLRQAGLLQKLFIAFVAVVVTINYVNMGCALDVEVVKKVLMRPVGPAVGFFCQFVIMPLIAYGVGYLVFSDPMLRLGLFTFGASPGGGASNMYTVLLGGNLNLSITMTFVSTVAAFGTIPLWLFTLGRTIIKDTKIVIPFTNILTSLVSLVIPIGIGLLIQWKLPKVAARSKRLLAPICIVLLICIIVLAAVANSYIFFLLSWRVVLASTLSVWAGFLSGLLVSVVMRFPYEDVVAVTVETGIQNSGIAFLLLSYTLDPPVSDMASVVPVAGSIITPIPLFTFYCFLKLRNYLRRSDNLELESIHKKTDDYFATVDTLGDSKTELCMK